jgi:hypothetical protein
VEGLSEEWERGKSGSEKGKKGDMEKVQDREGRGRME